MLDLNTAPSREHKSNVFAMLFSEPKATLELYNALTGQNYPPDTKIEIVTLSNALFKGQLNDVALCWTASSLSLWSTSLRLTAICR